LVSGRRLCVGAVPELKIEKNICVFFYLAPY
jgi:hypothetical protein